MRAAIYARYSSDLQRPASIDDQVRRCRQEVATRGWREIAAFSDREIAGTVAQRRPEYQRLLASAKAKQFEVVVVDELSRLTRDSEELAGLRKRLQFWGVHLRTLDGLDTVASPQSAGPMMLAKGFVNEAELEANAHRSRRGLEGRVRARQHAGGLIYGYRTRSVHADRPGDPTGTGRVIGYEYVIHAEEAETVRRIFSLYADGISPRRIAALLNAEGIPPPGARWKNRTGVRKLTWSHTAIAGDRRIGTGVLNNCKYDGLLIWNRSEWPKDPDQDGKQVRRNLPQSDWVEVDAPDLRIVSRELWDAVKVRQGQQAREGSRPAANWRNRRLLSGLLVCGKCGGSYSLRGKNTYCCSTRQNRGTVVCDCMVTVNAAVAEQAVLDELEAVFCADGFLEKLLGRVQQRWREAQTARAQHRSSVRALRQKLSEAQAEIQRLVAAVVRGVLVDELTAQMKAAESRRDRLRDELAVAEGAELPAALNILPATIRQIVSDLPAMLAAGQLEPVKSALKRLVGRIEVQAEEVPGRKRPGAVLVLRGNLEAALQLASEKVKGGNSPGGIRTRDPMAENHVS